ncbi:hypothetical protein [Paraburkholderia kirstenboschensis]|uniref:Uncharacterized protein n=1 Tax=Paraburkholderia kirstenboschensis TaxID=1245436 RepID=A0ABZ0EQA1_9BURK|nr:hypothetical protein [Paraburkholderia kirstenboschensis]WOD19095.1 hypothetical protein RW095_22795 [Paraburkholderia kirstenboschensis]
MRQVHTGGEPINVLKAPETVKVLRDLYIVSSAAAQRGGYGLEVSPLQWNALAERTEAARTVLDREFVRDADTAGALRHLLEICAYIIEFYIAPRECPSAVWREAGRLGREAYGWIDPDVNPEHGPGV